MSKSMTIKEVSNLIQEIFSISQNDLFDHIDWEGDNLAQEIKEHVTWNPEEGRSTFTTVCVVMDLGNGNYSNCFFAQSNNIHNDCPTCGGVEGD